MNRAVELRAQRERNSDSTQGNSDTTQRDSDSAHRDSEPNQRQEEAVSNNAEQTNSAISSHNSDWTRLADHQSSVLQWQSTGLIHPSAFPEVFGLGLTGPTPNLSSYFEAMNNNAGLPVNLGNDPTGTPWGHLPLRPFLGTTNDAGLSAIGRDNNAASSTNSATAPGMNSDLGSSLAGSTAGPSTSSISHVQSLIERQIAMNAHYLGEPLLSANDGRPRSCELGLSRRNRRKRRRQGSPSLWTKMIISWASM